MPKDDAELVSRSIEGDTDAYGELVERYQGAVYATAFYYVGRYGAAEDVSQDALLSAYRSLGRIKSRESFGPWLKEIACRTSANWLRRHAKRIQSETPLPFRRTISIEDARESARGKLEREEVFERVQKAIDSLPERYRLPVVLRYLQELSYEEICAYTGDTKEEVRGILQRAGHQLRELLADMNRDSEGESSWHPAQK